MHYPHARSRWERLAWWRKRRCAKCGARWECIAAKAKYLREQPSTVRNDQIVAWGAGNTAAYPQVGRAGMLTPAQDFRAGGTPPW